MNYHLYFHDDFDGMASGAVMLNFLRSCGDNITSFNPIDYSPTTNKNWVNFKFKRPFILVDFRYHLRADWWFDHHKASFSWPVLQSWKEKYKNDQTHHWDPAYKSCCGMIFDFLKKHYQYYLPQFIKELAKWADIIDGARYKSARESIEYKKPALKLGLYLLNENNPKRQIAITKELASKPIAEIIKNPFIKNKLKVAFKDHQKALNLMRHISLFSDGIVFADASDYDLDVSHFMSYFIFPSVKYSVLLEKEKGRYFHLGVGKNPWNKPSHRFNVSKLLQKYGGGGHENVGAVEKKLKKEILKIASEIVKYLEKHG